MKREHFKDGLTRRRAKADHISSLLAVREGVPDDFLLSLQDKLRAAILAAEGG